MTIRTLTTIENNTITKTIVTSATAMKIIT